MKSYKTLVFVALLGVVAAGCQKPEELKPTDNTNKNVLTLTVNASIDDDTKALAWDENKLKAYWAANEIVDVYLGETKIGYLTSESSDNGSTKLSGEIIVDDLSVDAGNPSTLMLLYPGTGDSESERAVTYLNQNGGDPTASVPSPYDYALASISAYIGDNSIETSGNASFANQQSIFRFVSNVSMSSFTISSANGKLVQSRTIDNGVWTSSYGSITVTTGDSYSATGKDYFVALRNEFVPEGSGTDEFFFSFVKEDDGILYEASKTIKNAAFDANGLINGKLMKAKITFAEKVIAQAASGTIDEQTDVL